MLNAQHHEHAADHDHAGAAADAEFRDIHPLTPQARRQAGGEAPWEAASRHTSTLSVGSEFTTMSREFGAMVVAGAVEEQFEETNPLAIVPDSNPGAPPVPSPRRQPEAADGGGGGGAIVQAEGVSVAQVKKEEVESKISAWQTAEIAKINSRFKREEVIINGWESEQVEKATAWLKKLERKLEEQRARAMEKMQNDVARANRKGEEKRASAEARRGTKVARVLDVAHLMRAVGRAPSKRSFF